MRHERRRGNRRRGRIGGLVFLAGGRQYAGALAKLGLEQPVLVVVQVAVEGLQLAVGDDAPEQRLGMVGPRQEDQGAPATDALDLVMSERLSANGEQ